MLKFDSDFFLSFFSFHLQGNLTNEDLDSEDIDDSIDSSDDCLDGLNAHDAAGIAEALPVDGATEDDLNDLASDLESDIRHNSLSSYSNDLQHSRNCNKNNANNHLQRQIHHSRGLRACSQTSDIEENIEALDVSSTHLQQQQQHHHPHHLLQTTTTSRDCIQTKVRFRNRKPTVFF